MAEARSVEELQCLLQRCGSSGISVYEHLNDVVAALVAEQPDDPYEAFERVSEAVKAQKDIKAGRQQAKAASHVSRAQSDSKKVQKEEWLKSTRRLIKEADPAKEIEIPASCPDFLEENRLLNWAGCGFSEAEAFRICCALKRLAASSPGLVSARFWGKILGVEADYIIAETQFEGEEPVVGDQETEESMDRRGTGANTYTYYVLQGSNTKWQLLPDVLPSQIAAVRKIKKLFSGDLDRPVITFPCFLGRERHLLRATIALVSSETTLCPAGLLQVPEDGSTAEEDPEFEFPTAKALASVDGWTHSRPHLTQGGLSCYPDVEEEDEASSKIQQLMEQDPILELNRPAKDDPNLSEGRPAWTARLVGDTATYKDTTYGIAVVHSGVWPGAVTVCRNKTFSSIYCGWGLRHGSQPLFPVAPQDVQVDPPDLDEQPEPQPGDEELSDGASHDEEEPEPHSDEDAEEEEEPEE